MALSRSNGGSTVENLFRQHESRLSQKKKQINKYRTREKETRNYVVCLC